MFSYITNNSCHSKLSFVRQHLIICCLSLALFTSFAFSQENNDVNLYGDTVNTHNNEISVPYSESHAFKSSLWSTLIPLPTVVLTIPGIVVGPSTGYFYSDMKGRAWRGIALRTVGLGGMISSFAICSWDNCGPGDDNYTTAWIVFASSAGLMVASAVYDIASIKKDTRKKNDSIVHSSLSLVPRYFVQTKSVGVTLRLRF